MKYCSIVLFLSLFCSLSMTSCRPKRLHADDISYLFLDYDTYTPNNIGNQIAGTVSAQMITGEALPLKNNQGFSSSENIHVKISDGNFLVSTRLESFKQNKVPVTFSYTDKDDITITSNDTLLLNFTGDARLSGSASSGTSGSKGSNGGTSMVGRDGNDGNFGQAGGIGSDARDLEVHVWRSNDSTFFHVKEIGTNYISRFIVVGPTAKLNIYAYGGAGGSGGAGGDGGNGKNGENVNGKAKLPGMGGRGGNGGAGGPGGRGGNVVVTIHPSVTEIEKVLIVFNYGGNGGSGGKGGDPGKAGTALAGQSTPLEAKKGTNGSDGFSGIDGQTLMLNQDFDISQYNQ